MASIRVSARLGIGESSYGEASDGAEVKLLDGLSLDWSGGKIRGMEGRQPPILNYADARPQKWITIALFPDEVTAHLASSKPDAAGIETILGNQLNPFTGGSNSTGICVRSDDVEAAIAVLTDSPAKRWLVGQ